MTQLVYNFLISLYAFGINLAGLFSEKARKMRVGRKDLFENLTAKLGHNTKPVAWFHCASLGEFEQGRPVIEAFSTRYPNYLILLTFFSSSGYENKKYYDKAHIISYLPYDIPSQVNQFLQIVKPNIVFFIKYEFWKNFLSQLTYNQTPTYLISANFRKNQLFFSKNTDFFRNIIHYFSHIFVQNEISKSLLESIDYQNITVAGDSRFDRVWALARNPGFLEKINQFKGTSKLLVIGSAWEQDFDFLIPFFNKLPFPLKIIIAPHEIDPKSIKSWISKLQLPAVKYSEFIQEAANLNSPKIMLIDNIGMLSKIYQYADYVWIGGAFGKGLHNILEAATYGKPIFFGNKNYKKFKEANDLISLNAAFCINHLADFINEIQELEKNEKKYWQTCQTAKNYIEKNTGATDKIMNLINHQLNKTKA